MLEINANGLPINPSLIRFYRSLEALRKNAVSIIAPRNQIGRYNTTGLEVINVNPPIYVQKTIGGLPVLISETIPQDSIRFIDKDHNPVAVITGLQV